MVWGWNASSGALTSLATPPCVDASGMCLTAAARTAAVEAPPSAADGGIQHRHSSGSSGSSGGAWTAEGQVPAGGKTCSVIDYSASCKGDGVSDCTDAFRLAAKDCASHAGAAQLLVPPGRFLTGPFELSGSGWDGGALRLVGTVLAARMGSARWPARPSPNAASRSVLATALNAAGQSRVTLVAAKGAL